MRNWKVSVKLFVGFAIVILMTCLLGSFGYYVTHEMSQAEEELYEKNIQAIEILGSMRTNLQQQRVNLRNLILYDPGQNTYKLSVSQLSELEQSMSRYLKRYKETISISEDDEQFQQFESLYVNEFSEEKRQVSQFASQNDDEKGRAMLDSSTKYILKMTESLNLCFELNSTAAENSVKSNMALFNKFSVIQSVLVLLAMAIAIFLVFYLNRIISKPLRKMVSIADTIAEGGMGVDVDYYSDDEVGMLAQSFRDMTAGINLQTAALSQLASGDFSITPQVRSDKDTVGHALEDMTVQFNHVVEEIMSVSEEVSLGANHVSEGSHSLAQGAAEQASAIEQLSSSIFEISLNTKENAKMADNAASLYTDIKNRAQEGSQLMSQMMKAVDEINEASASISKIMKLINDISFQTNILSLNAAVEAANAGQHGKGFAVVAGEVRNLAAKSAKAAEDTDILVENSLEKARLGATIANKTYDSLNQIVVSILESSQLIDDIAKSSGEQSLGIEQVNIGIEQVAQVINLNSSTAEKSAMAAEEMAAQASMMKKLVSGFKLRSSNREYSTTDQNPIAPPPLKDLEPEPVIILDDDFGKY